MAGTIGWQTPTAGGGDEPVDSDDDGSWRDDGMEYDGDGGLLGDFLDQGTTERPLAGSTVWETSPYRTAGDSANPTDAGTEVTPTTSHPDRGGGDQPIDATDATLSDPFDVEVDAPDLPDTGDLLPDLDVEAKIALGVVVLIVLAVVVRPYASAGATVADTVA